MSLAITWRAPHFAAIYFRQPCKIHRVVRRGRVQPEHHGRRAAHGDVPSSTKERELLITDVGECQERAPGAPGQGSPVTISVRPETLTASSTVPSGWNRFPATVERIVFRGMLLRADGSEVFEARESGALGL